MYATSALGCEFNRWMQGPKERNEREAYVEGLSGREESRHG